MKQYFIETKYEKEIRLTGVLIKRLPKSIALFTTVQFIDQVDRIKKELENKGIDVKLVKLNHCEYKGQVLGCSIEKLDIDIDKFLYIGDGEFHPKALVFKNDIEVIAYNPFNEKIRIYTKKDVGNLNKKLKGSILKFLTSKNIGVLITLKKGQNRMKDALSLEKKFKDKNFYFLVNDTIDFNSLEDFNYIDCFVNTACPRIGYDDTIKVFRPIINIDEVNKL